MEDAGVDEVRDEREWEAEKRDFVADRRDEIADERERAADERDAVADERERAADERERAADEPGPHARRAGTRGEVLPSSGERDRRIRQVAHSAARDRAHEDREERGALREIAAAARAGAAERRQGAAGATGLAMAYAEIARYLYEAEDFEGVLERIVDVAVAIVTGCDMASVTVRDGGAFRTVASTDERAIEADRAQYEADEGPCLDAVEEPVVHVPSLPDERWPSLGSRPLEHGVQAVTSYRLATPRAEDDGALAGSLNAYASSPNAFDDDALEIGLILASHASVAVQAVRERESLELFGSHLHDALSSRDVIGLAKGILMERLKVTPEEAFDYLRRSSQRLNMKLREVADRLAATGELDEGPGSSD